MTDNNIVDISEKLSSLQDKILKSRFAETVTESEMLYLVLATQEINRQQAEIERLYKNNKTLENVIKNNFISKAGYDIDPLKEIKSEAIKEFAEKLKFELEIAFDEPIFDTIIGNIIESIIDKLLKELTHEPTKIEHNSLCETETYERR